MIFGRIHNLFGLFRREDMAGAGHHAIVNADTLLRIQLFHQLLHGSFRHQFIIGAMQDQSAAGARCQEAEIIMRSGRADGNKAAHFRPAHQHLHANISAERITKHPLGRRIGIHGLQEIQPRAGIGDFANATIITALAAPHTTHIEAQHGKAQRLHALIQRMNDAVIHRAAMQRVRVQQQRRGGIRALGMVIASFKPAIRPGEHYFWHGLFSYPFHF